MSDTSPYETAGRLRKAGKLVEQLLAASATSEQVAECDEDFWAVVASHAAVPMPSQATREVVIEMLRNYEKARSAA